LQVEEVCPVGVGKEPVLVGDRHGNVPGKGAKRRNFQGIRVKKHGEDADKLIQSVRM
jgi:hypothetical protein